MSEPQSGPTPYGSTPFRAPPPRKRSNRRTLLWILLAIAVAVVVAVVLTPHTAKTGGSGGGGGRGGRRPPTVIGVATAQLGDVPIELMALGTVTPVANVTVHTHIAGTLMTVNFHEGQMVKEGQLLALVDERPYDIALQQAQGQLLRDEAMLADARLDLTRYRKLLAQDSIQGQQVDTQAALVKQDEGLVKTDEAAVNNAKLNIIYCHITAPVAGRVGLRQVDAGNYVNIGDTNGVVIITTLDPIDVEFTLPEDNVPQIAQRVAAGAVLTATAYDRTGSNLLAQGTLLTLDNQIDTTTGTIKAKARFHNASGVLFPSQFVNVKLLVDTKTNQVVAPTQAVRHGSKGDYVFTVEDGTAKMNMVKVGVAAGERTSIDSGIKAGDQVITDGGDRLTDGATVLLPGQTPPNSTRKAKPSGPFGWIAGLFAPKTPAAGGEAASASGGGQSAGSAAPGTAGGRGGGAGRMQAMIDQLNLAPDQKAKAAPILAEMRQKIAAAGDDPDARRAALRDGMHALNDILTPDQKAKLEQLRGAARASYGGGAPSSPPASAAPPAPAAPAASAASASAPAAHAGGAGGGDRMARLADFLDLDADQRAKAKAIFADGPSPEAFAQFRAILRPDQQAKLAARRAQRGAEHGGDSQ
jgi:multidrug efflux system membrane fusion protein